MRNAIAVFGVRCTFRLRAPSLISDLAPPPHRGHQSFLNQLSGGEPAEQRGTAEQHTAGVCLGLDRSDFVCTKCKLVSILEEKIEGLEQQITTLRCIRETEDFLDKSQDMLLRAQSSKDLEQVAQRSQEASEEAWQHVTSRRRRGNVWVPATWTQRLETGAAIPAVHTRPPGGAAGQASCMLNPTNYNLKNFNQRAL
ncbi:uncharacterized protein LOC144271751 [Eretmochelys imbricata]